MATTQNQQRQQIQKQPTETALAIAGEVAPIETTSTAIALIPSSLDGAFQLAGWLATSSFLPDKLRGKPGDVFAIILAGVELGLPPMAALRGIYIVNGKTACEGRTKAAVCLQRGAALYIKRTEYTPLATTWETKRKGAVEPVSIRYTADEAKKAGLLDKEGPWRNYSQRMISHRALGWLLDDVYPDILMGVATAEDFDEVEGQQFAPLGGGVEVSKTAAKAPAAGAPTTAKSVQSEVAEVKPDVAEMTADEANVIEKEIVQARDKKTLKDLMSKRISPRPMPQAIRDRLAKACGDQFALINEAARQDAELAASETEAKP